MAALPITLLTNVRLAVGAVNFLVPSSVAKLMGHPAPASSVISNRLWASRDGILAVMLLSASSEESVRLALIGGLAADVLDVLSVALGLWDGSVGTTLAMGLGGGAMAFVGLGLAALNRLGGRKS